MELASLTNDRVTSSNKALRSDFHDLSIKGNQATCLNQCHEGSKDSGLATLHSFFRKDKTGRIQLVQEIVAQGARTVPSTYVLPPAHRPCLSLVRTTDCVPVVDVAELHGDGRKRALVDIAQACQDWGFLQVINHGVSRGIIDKMWKTAEKFFGLPAEERAHFYLQDTRNAPCEDNTSNTVLAWRETLRFRGVSEASANVPEFCREPVKQYLDEMTVLALKLNKAIMETLGSTGQDMGEMNLSKKGLSIHLYPECPDPTLTLGSKQHVDITTLTILLGTEEVGGLQLLKDGHWVDYKPIPGSFAVILGEQMKRLSNGKYKSVQHRVVTNVGKKRMSVASFFLPPVDAKIGPLPHLIDHLHPPLFSEAAIAQHLPLASQWFN